MTTRYTRDTRDTRDARDPSTVLISALSVPEEHKRLTMISGLGFPSSQRPLASKELHRQTYLDSKECHGTEARAMVGVGRHSPIAPRASRFGARARSVSLPTSLVSQRLIFFVGDDGKGSRGQELPARALHSLLLLS